MTAKIASLALVTLAVCVPAPVMGMASAELYSTQAHFYGRFDARIRYAPGDGVVSTFFLWKEGSEASGAYWAELDYEKIAADCHMQLNNIYGNPKAQHQTTPSLGFAMCEGYHDYRIEWTPTYIAWVVDGKEIRRDTGTNATAYAQNATGGMTFHFNIWPGNSSFGGNINNTTLPVHQYISWVEYASYDNGNFKVEWREEFESSGVPSGWAVGNWASSYNLSTHNAQNVGFVNGIAVLSLTADNATGNPGTPPADSSAGGASGAGGSGAGGSAGAGGTTTARGGTGGGSSASGGTTSTGGTITTGGSVSSGGRVSTGGSTTSGGTIGSGGSSPTGGTVVSGGTIGSGGRSSAGGTVASGGTIGSGGRSPSGGAVVSGGTNGSGGTTASGGTIGSGGTPRTDGTTGAGGASSSGGSNGAGGTTETVGPTAAGGDARGGSAGTTATQGGCSCNTAPTASPFGLALVVLLLLGLRLRRKEI